MCNWQLPNFCLLVCARGQGLVVVQLAPFERVGAGTVEQHHRALGRLFAQRRAFAFDFLQLGHHVAARSDDLQLAVLELGLALIGAEHDRAVFQFAIDLELAFAQPAFTGQPANIGHGMELTASLGNHLHAHRNRLASRILDLAQVFPLKFIVGIIGARNLSLGRAGGLGNKCQRGQGK